MTSQAGFLKCVAPIRVQIENYHTARYTAQRYTAQIDIDISLCYSIHVEAMSRVFGMVARPLREGTREEPVAKPATQAGLFVKFCASRQTPVFCHTEPG